MSGETAPTKPNALTDLAANYSDTSSDDENESAIIAPAPAPAPARPPTPAPAPPPDSVSLTFKEISMQNARTPDNEVQIVALRGPGPGARDPTGAFTSVRIKEEPISSEDDDGSDCEEIGSVCTGIQSQSETEDSQSDSEDSDSVSASVSRKAKKGSSAKNPKKRLPYHKSSKSTKNEFLGLSLDLPQIQDLTISVPHEQTTPIGIIKSVVDPLVIVESFPMMPALDLDTVLFLDEGDRVLGQIFDVWGQVKQPHYSVRFNSKDHILKNGIGVGMRVFCAPRTEHTSFVLIAQLEKFKGSDSPWIDEETQEEIPPELRDYSDDEEERNAKGIGEGTGVGEPSKAKSRGRGRGRGRKSNSRSRQQDQLPFAHRRDLQFQNPQNPNRGRPRFHSNPIHHGHPGSPRNPPSPYVPTNIPGFSNFNHFNYHAQQYQNHHQYYGPPPPPPPQFTPRTSQQPEPQPPIYFNPFNSAPVSGAYMNYFNYQYRPPPPPPGNPMPNQKK